MEKLYHGSQYSGLTQILHCVLPNGNWKTYATSNRLVALVEAGSFDFRKCGIRQDYRDGRYTLCEMYPDAFVDVFAHEGFLYEVDPEGFEQDENHPEDYYNPDNGKILGVTSIHNVLAEITSHQEFFNLVYYADTDNPYWDTVDGGRPEAVKQQKAKVEFFNKLLGPEENK